jgi:DNA-binding CsgD family transcriptional regulator
VGQAFGQAVADVLDRCESELPGIAQGAAVLAEFGSVGLLGRLLDLDTDTAGHMVTCLEDAGLLEGGLFRHAAVRAAVRAGLDDRDRSRLHWKAAELLHQEGAPAPAVARHLVLAGRTSDPWAVPVLQGAAEHALAEDEVEAAVEYLELAERACAGGRARAAIAAMLVTVKWRLDPAAAIRYLPPMVAALREGHLGGGQALVLARYLLWHGRVQEATETLAQAVTTLGAEPDGGASDELSVTRMWLASSFPPLATNLPPEPAVVPPVPLTVKPRLQAASVLKSVLTRATSGDALIGAVDWAEQVLQGSRLNDATVEAVESALLALIYADRLDKAASWCEALLEDAGRRRAPWWQRLFASLQAKIEFRKGNLAAAERNARFAMAGLPAQSWGTGIGVPLASLLLATTAMGEYVAAADCVNQPVDDAMFQTRYGLHYLHARGAYYLATARPHAALGDFLACGELMGAWGLDLPALVPWRTEAARALLVLDRRDEARDLTIEQLSLLGHPQGTRTRGLSLRLLAATSELRRRPQLLGEAVEVLQASGDRLELARALADLSDAHQSLGSSNRARTLVRRAWQVAKECGADALCQELMPTAVRTPPAKAGVPAGNALSDAERRVAALAALGHTNREIAGRLYITISTVEQHLTHAYRKLNVTRRGDLPTCLLSDTADID